MLSFDDLEFGNKFIDEESTLTQLTQCWINERYIFSALCNRCCPDILAYETDLVADALSLLDKQVGLLFYF